MLLKGKVVLVTGGARGLGRVDALALAEAGADVVVADILDAEKTANEVRSMERKSLAIKMDVTNMAEVKEGVEKIKKDFGSIDILVNNAATLDHLGQVLEQKDKLWERDLRVNLTGTYNCSRAVWPLCKRRSGEGSSIWPLWQGRSEASDKPVTLPPKLGSSGSPKHWPWKERGMGLTAMWFAQELLIQNLFSLSLLK